MLKVEDIVVCGHSHCGAITGVLRPETLKDLPAVAEWLVHAEKCRRRSSSMPRSPIPDDDLLTAAIKSNVLVQLDHLRTYPAVALAESAGELTLHGCFYRFETGDVSAFDSVTGKFVCVRSTYANEATVADAATEIALEKHTASHDTSPARFERSRVRNQKAESKWVARPWPPARIGFVRGAPINRRGVQLAKRTFRIRVSQRTRPCTPSYNHRSSNIKPIDPADGTLWQRLRFYCTPIDGRYEDLTKGPWYLNVFRDFTAGLIVAMVAIPLAMGFAMASGLPPEMGIVGGAVAGLVGALFGGSKYQVYGPTAAFIPVIPAITTKYEGYDFLDLVLACSPASC